jgi:hypothetical protein
MPRIANIQIRHDIAANWTTINPVLSLGEMGVETDTWRTKSGDGTAAWAALPYSPGNVVSQTAAPTAVVVGLKWYRLSTSQLFVYLIDGATPIWREIT